MHFWKLIKGLIKKTKDYNRHHLKENNKTKRTAFLNWKHYTSAAVASQKKKMKYTKQKHEWRFKASLGHNICPSRHTNNFFIINTMNRHSQTFCILANGIIAVFRWTVAAELQQKSEESKRKKKKEEIEEKEEEEPAVTVKRESSYVRHGDTGEQPNSSTVGGLRWRSSSARDGNGESFAVKVFAILIFWENKRVCSILYLWFLLIDRTPTAKEW